MYRPYMGNCFLFVLHGITIDSLEQPFPLKLVGKLCVQERKKNQIVSPLSFSWFNCNLIDHTC